MVVWLDFMVVFRNLKNRRICICPGTQRLERMAQYPSDSGIEFAGVENVVVIDWLEDEVASYPTGLCIRR